MGLYSKNTINSIAVEESTVVNEQNEIMQMIDEAEVIDCDLLEAAIQIHENDHKMFNALIECDFIEAANNTYMTEAEAEEANAAGDEKKSGNIKEKITQVFEAACRAIASAAQSFIAKIKQLLNNDAKLVKAYSGVLTAKNLEGFKGLANFAFPKTNIDEDTLASKVAEEFTADFEKAIKTAEERDAIDSAWESFKTKVSEREEIIKKLGSDEAFFEKKVDSFVPTDIQIKKMINSVSSASDTISAIKKKASEIIGQLKANKKLAAGNKMKGGSVEAYKMNKIYQAAKDTCVLFTKEMKAYTGLASKQIAAYRKAFIICGKYAASKAKGTKPEAEKMERVQGEVVENESALIWAIAESSDAYVFETLAY